MKSSKILKMLAGLGVVFVFLVACGSADDLPPTRVPTSTLAEPADDNATSGAQVRSTHLAQATLNAKSTLDAQETLKAYQSATAQAHIYETATVVAHVTGQAVFAAKSGWHKLLSEPFKDNALGWPLGVTTDQSPVVTAEIADGGYQWAVVVPHGGSYINLIPEKGPKFSAFYASVSLQFIAGEDGDQTSYGLVFRRVGKDYGFFGISSSGEFRILDVHDSGIYSLEQESSDLINTRPGEINRLAVVGIGPDFVFLINDQMVGQMNAELDSGQIGLGVDALNSAGQSKIRFSDFEVAAP